MKFNNKYLLGLALLPMMTGCADYLDTNNFIVEKPATTAQYEYLNEYKPIKEYITRANPNFKIGCAVEADEYLKRGAVYLLTNSNFEIVTAGNAMKYGSVVGDDGTMNFSTVSSFVDAATDAGLEVYGHTLCWHSQQNVKWLNTLLADKEIEMDPNAKDEIVDFELNFADEDGYYMWHQCPDATTFWINKDEGCLQIDNPEAVNFWEVQYFTFDNVKLKKDQEYQLTVTLRGTSEGAVQGNVGGWGDNVGIRIPYTTDWETKTINFTSATDDTTHGLFQTGDLVGTIQYKSIKISHLETPLTEYEAVEERECLQVITDDMVDAAWDSQFWLVFDGVTFNEGDSWEVSMEVRADKEASIGTQVHAAPGGYLHWSAIGSVPFTNEWTTYKANGTCTGEWNGGYSIAFNLNDLAKANKYYFDDISFKLNGQELISNGSCDMGGSTANYVSKEMRGDLVPSRLVDKFTVIKKGNTIPMTAEEKAEALTNEMERWIKGMMEATGGKVKAWDVVNEAISGGPWGQRYDLQHAANGGPNDFFWQDYLGDDYVRIPVKFARQYFEEFGGNPADLKLFVNDYNLESDWDDNQKLKSLIEWIAQWESDGETVIDGIGTQMHISYYLNPETQKSKEDHIVKMFELMAASGKLCRITELDMGICDAEGNSMKTADVTFEQQQAMSDFYKWIIGKYFEIIPASQQFGICQWALTDSPENSGWRAGEPIGLWDQNYSRKPAYAGFAEGIQGN